MFGPTNFIGTTIASTTTRMTVYADEKFMRMKKEDFYGGRTGPLEKFHLFIFFLNLVYIIFN